MASRICDLRAGAGRDAALAARRALSMSPRAAGAVGSRYSNRMSSVRCAGRASVVLSGQLGGLAGIAAESWAGGSTVAAICTRGGSPPPQYHPSRSIVKYSGRKMRHLNQDSGGSAHKLEVYLRGLNQ